MEVGLSFFVLLVDGDGAQIVDLYLEVATQYLYIDDELLIGEPGDEVLVDLGGSKDVGESRVLFQLYFSQFGLCMDVEFGVLSSGDFEVEHAVGAGSFSQGHDFID